MSLRIPIALFAIAVAWNVSFAAGPAIMPQKFSAVVGGFLGSSYTIELHDGALHYTEKSHISVGYGATSSAIVTPTLEQWQEFRQSIERFNIWRWHADYPSQGTEDGTQWSLELVYADHALKSHGDNNYPDPTGKPNGEPHATETFNRYLAAIKKLVGGRRFE